MTCGQPETAAYRSGAEDSHDAGPATGATAAGSRHPGDAASVAAGAGTATAAAGQGAVQKPADAIRIASYNIQVFGTSKLAKPQVVDTLVKVVRHFDIVAIQEVRAKDDTIMPQIRGGHQRGRQPIRFAIGPRLGRTVSTEQYAFVFDTNRIEVDRLR